MTTRLILALLFVAILLSALFAGLAASYCVPCTTTGQHILLPVVIKADSATTSQSDGARARHIWLPLLNRSTDRGS